MQVAFLVTVERMKIHIGLDLACHRIEHEIIEFDDAANTIVAAGLFVDTEKLDFIRTQVFPGNVDGMRFYERNGFCEMMKTIECQSLD